MAMVYAVGAVALAGAVWLWFDGRPVSQRHDTAQVEPSPLVTRRPPPEPQEPEAWRHEPAANAPHAEVSVPAAWRGSVAPSAAHVGGSEDGSWPDEQFAVRTVDALIDRLSSDDPHIVLDAADGLRARNAVEAIPTLAALDITASPDSARSVIDALGKLGGAADADRQKTATDRLIALLAQEKARPSPDAAGNVLQIYEALGDTRDPRAASALESELADPGVPLAALVVIAEALTKLNQASSFKPLSDARARVAALSFDDAFMMEVRADVLAALDAALGAR